MGWKGESRRHSLARKGIKTAKGVFPEDALDRRNLSELSNKDKIRVAIISGQGTLFIENISIDTLYEFAEGYGESIDDFGGLDEVLSSYLNEMYGSSINWQVIEKDVVVSKDTDIKLMKSLGITKKEMEFLLIPQTKGDAREQAIDFMNWASEQNLSYGELADYQDHFIKMGKRFGLTEEFKENGVI